MTRWLRMLPSTGRTTSLRQSLQVGINARFIWNVSIFDPLQRECRALRVVLGAVVHRYAAALTDRKS